MTWDPDEVLDEEQLNTLKVGMSSCLFTKKFYEINWYISHLVIETYSNIIIRG